MTARERCHRCDLPTATDEDNAAIPEGEGLYLCWSAWGGECEPIDWRARAMVAEAEVEALCAAAAPTLGHLMNARASACAQLVEAREAYERCPVGKKAERERLRLAWADAEREAARARAAETAAERSGTGTEGGEER